MSKEKDKVFVNITNQMIYDKINGICKKLDVFRVEQATQKMEISSNKSHITELESNSKWQLRGLIGAGGSILLMVVGFFWDKLGKI